MDDAPNDSVGSLKFLKGLVTTLTAVMILGFIVLIGVLVTRIPGDAGVTLPDSIQLPDGATAEAFTATSKWYAVVTKSGQILVFDRSSGAHLKTIEIESAN